MVFFKKRDAKPENEIWEVRATTLMFVLAKWYAWRDAWVPGFLKYQTAFVASLNVRTAFDVAKPSVVSTILTCMEIHNPVVAALLEEVKNVRGSACFETCEAEFRFSRCVRQSSVRTVEKPKGSGKPRGGGLL